MFSLILFRVYVPMGGSTEVFTSQNEDQQFNYANVRKAAYRGSKTILISDSETIIFNYISVQVLFNLGNIPNMVC